MRKTDYKTKPLSFNGDDDMPDDDRDWIGCTILLVAVILMVCYFVFRIFYLLITGQ